MIKFFILFNFKKQRSLFMATNNQTRKINSSSAPKTNMAGGRASDGWYSNTEFRKPLDIYNKINIHQLRDYSYSASIPGRWYLFIVKPSCSITPDTINCSRFLYHLSQHKQELTTGGDYLGQYILGQLNFNCDNRILTNAGYSPIIELLTNTAKEFTPSNTNLDTMSYAETPHGARHVYAKHDVSSTSSGTFSVNYIELEGEPILNLHKAWYEYIRLVREGTIVADPKFLKTRTLDYPSAAYYFVVAPDGFTLQYWCKYTGVYPIELPYSAFAGRSSMDFPDVSINYQYIKKDDMDPIVLDEFNYLFGKSRTSRKQFPMYYLSRLDEWIRGSKSERDQAARNAEYLNQKIELMANVRGMTVEEFLAKNPKYEKMITSANGTPYVQSNPKTASDVAVNFRTVNIRSLPDYTTDSGELEATQAEIVKISGFDSGSSKLGLIFN